MSRRSLVFLATLLVAASNALPAQAYYWGYSPYTGSANWQWIARSFGYPLNRLSTAATPLYLLNPLLYNASYAVVGGSKAARRQKQFEDYQKQAAQFQQQQSQYVQQGQPYTDPEPFNYPRQRMKPFMQSPYPVDQVAYAPWITGGPEPTWLGPDPINEDLSGVAPHTVPPLLAAGADNNPAQSATQGAPQSAPQTAPDFVRAANEPDGAGAPGASPFAAAFIELVRTKFKGNIARALNDKQARSLARTLKVVPEGKFDPDEIPLERLALIEKVLNDDKESPATRLVTVRLLLKH